MKQIDPDHIFLYDAKHLKPKPKLYEKIESHQETEFENIGGEALEDSEEIIDEEKLSVKFIFVFIFCVLHHQSYFFLFLPHIEVIETGNQKLFPRSF